MASVSFGVTTYDNQPQGTLRAQTLSIDQGLTGTSANQTLRTQEYRFNLYVGPSSNIDNKTLTTFVDPNNAAKNSIIGIGNVTTFDASPIFYASDTDAKAAASSLYGQASESNTNGVASGVESYLSAYVDDVIGGSYSVGDTVVNGFGTAVGTVAIPRTLVGGGAGLGFTGFLQIKSWSDSISIGSTLTASGITTTVISINYIGVASIFQDIVSVSKFPQLEPPDPSVTNPLSNHSSIVLDSTNAGQGVGNTFYANGLQSNTYDDFVFIQSGVPFLGDALAFDTSKDTASAASIAANRATVGTNRTGVTSYISASNAVKDLKSDASENVWVLKRMDPVLNDFKNNTNAAISVLDDPTFQS
tara:strand:+ start:7544 stop:8623 length:1080 start_codon:yes stop_codon:yes gene_type:complete